MIFWKKYVNNRNPNNLEMAFKNLNILFNNKISIEKMYQTINFLLALDSFGKNKQFELIDELIVSLNLENKEDIFNNTIKLLKYIDSEIEIKNIVVESKFPFTYKLKREFFSNIVKLLYTPFLLFLLFTLFKLLFGIELPT